MVLLATSCNDDSDDEVQHRLLPTRIARNGITLFDLVFDTERRLIRLNYYSDGEPASFYVYDYNKDGIQESRRYSVYNGNVLDVRSVFTLDNSGRINAIETYVKENDFEDPFSEMQLSYDPSGRLVGKQLDLASEPDYYIHEYTYSASNVCIETDKIYHPDKLLEYRILTEYVPADKPMYDHWNDFLLLLIVASHDDDILNMFCVSSRRRIFDSDGTAVMDWGMTTSAQQFNSDGYLTRQVLTFEDLADGDKSTWEMTYEYAE